MNRLKRVVLMILTIFILTSKLLLTKEKKEILKKSNKDFEFILNEEINNFNSDGNILDSSNSDKNFMLMDINTVTAEEMLTKKISNGYVKKIIDYREITGGFHSIAELKRISGIGEATFQRLKKKFKVSSSIIKKPIYINEADETVLKYYNFQKKEIQIIKKYMIENGRIKDNIELKKILSEKRYLEYKDLIRYKKN